jgi:hypothetical protein
MASVHTYDAIKGLISRIVAPLQLLDYDQIEPALESGTKSFYVLEELASYDETVSISGNSQVCRREDAVFAVHAYVPAPESSRDARVLAELLSFGILHQQENGVRITNVSPPDPGQQNDGLWTSATLVVDTVYDRHVAI